MADMNKEVTYFKFQSHINDFLTKLKNKPIQAQPSVFLKNRDFGKEKLIRILIRRGVLKRKESIKDPTNSEEKTAKYFVKYTIIRDGYEDKIKKLYDDYFGKKQITEIKTDVNECDGCGGGDCSSSIGGTSASSVGGQYTVPLGPAMLKRPGYNANRKKNKKVPEPENILGKTVMGENKKRNIYLTEEQMNYILKKQGVLNEEGEAGGIGGATTTFSVGAETTRGDMGYDVPAFSKNKNTTQNKKQKGLKTDFFAGAMDRTPGLSCADHVGKDGKVHSK